MKNKHCNLGLVIYYHVPNMLLKLYESGSVTQKGLNKAVILKWITEEEKLEIIDSVSSAKKV